MSKTTKWQKQVQISDDNDVRTATTQVKTNPHLSQNLRQPKGRTTIVSGFAMLSCGLAKLSVKELLFFVRVWYGWHR